VQIWIGKWFDRSIGLASLVVGLAILSAIPIVSFLSLGYMLEASGRVIQSGRLRDGLVGLDKAARLGKIALGTWLLLWPLRAISQLADAAYIIDPNGPSASRWQQVTWLFLVLTACHLVWACLRGGRLRHFFWPAPIAFVRWLQTSGKYTRIRDACCSFFVSLQLRTYFTLGLKGFAGAFAWLFIPLSILIVASYLPEGWSALLSFIGIVALAPAILYLPFLQMNFALKKQLSAYFEITPLRLWFRQAPLLSWSAIVVILVSAVPLYLLKIELTPQEVTWLPALLFVLLILPAKLYVAWVVAYARKQDGPANTWCCYGARLGTIPVVFTYVCIVYATQYLAWHGSWSLLEQHAFLVPTPF
jgi:hypothetical protein